ncbi:hypothetical protein GN244_ATG03975 [Phytophthora infestans]|uniref:Uncharacterized protein n=1 Tax=Phytophthora infestans TaxID=4787 RepID=A0A833S9S1_PHYIN|nr:hypothetical protein GN244_ATG03975 [Phytophthora infestans]
MEGTLPSYEAAMRDARAYLHRRDLSSEDEIPLYFAWQRLYASANANLSTNFMQETRAELRARQEARLAPRRGIPPPLFTSFDRNYRTSAQSSAFLRAGTSSDAAIEMMARRYRREAEKLRSSREKLLNELDEVDKRVKKGKRHKSPLQEVDELLGSIEREGGRSDTDDLLSTKTVKGQSARSSGTTTKRMMKTLRQQNAAGLDSDDEVDTSKVLPKSKARMSTVSKLGVGSSMASLGNRDDIGTGINSAKAAALRRLNLSRTNPAAVPSLSAEANVAAFPTRVADWRMPPDIDRASLAPELFEKGTARTSSASGKGLSGANEIRGSAPVESGEADMTFETSSGSSGLEGGGLDADASFNARNARVSPMSRHAAKREGAAKDKTKESRSQPSDNEYAEVKGGNAPSRGLSDTVPRSIDAQQTPSDSNDNATQKSEFQQKLLQLSHAVGDMQVKIQGKQIEFTFTGALDDGSGDGERKPAGKSLQYSEMEDETKQPVAARNAARHTEREGGDTAELQGNAPPAKGVNVPRIQSSVRFAGAASTVDNGSYSEGGRLTDEQGEHTKPAQQNVTDGSFTAPPARYEGRPRQMETSRSHENASNRQTTPVAGFADDDEEDKGTEPLEPNPLEAHLRLGEPQQQSTGKEHLTDGDKKIGGNSTGSSATTQNAMSAQNDSISERQEHHRSPSRGQSGEQNVDTHGSTRESHTKGTLDGKPSHLDNRPSNLRRQQENEQGVHIQSGEEDVNKGHVDERAAAYGSPAMNQEGALERQDNLRSTAAGRHHEQGKKRIDNAHDAKTNSQIIGPTCSDEWGSDEDDSRTNANEQPPRTSKDKRSMGDSQDNHHSQSERKRDGSAKEGVQVGNYTPSDEGVDEGGKARERVELRSPTSNDENENLKPDNQDGRRSHDKGPREQATQREDEFKDVKTGRSRGVHQPQASSRQDKAALNERSSRGNEGVNTSKHVEQTSRTKRDSHEAPQRLSRTSGGVGEQKSSTKGRGVSASSARNVIELDTQSFSDASEDTGDDKIEERELTSDSESIVVDRNTERSSIKSSQQVRPRRHKPSTRSSSREQILQHSLATKPEKLRTSRPSPNKQQELPDSELSSDEDLSDGPDTPHKRYYESRRHSSDRQQSRILNDSWEARPPSANKRISSRSKSSRRSHFHSKQRYVSSDNSSTTDQSDSDEQDEQSSGTAHRSSSSHHSRSRRTTKSHHHPSRASRHSTRESTHRSRDLQPELDSLQDEASQTSGSTEMTK